jgi:predicted transcriptional regulator
MADNRNRGLASAQLDANVVEQILEACANNEASIVRLMNSTSELVPYYTLKKYLFYLIEYDMISYHGKKGVYTIKYEGWRLLSMIKRVKNMPNATMTIL